ncbi:hypothetical protein K435DRAFT_875104 [Dendrothele bispora CBS 962.96]|uniref:Uncharacterized protein n=1 Tax=Dendrothele bispora (strain CBS 962.96) TaxID=1314807 RepID=A0A4S8KV16_DENBC|nr:hypothetical protein K435DRAFT_875104 [Dendrothele bispora CBS 962.96]
MSQANSFPNLLNKGARLSHVTTGELSFGSLPHRLGICKRLKIAYDPRDLEDVGMEEEKIGGKMTKSTIMEEVLLLGSRINKCVHIKNPPYLRLYPHRAALCQCIAVVHDPARRRLPLSERLIEVIDDRQTEETILDEALKMMKSVQDPPSGGAGYVSGGEEKMIPSAALDKEGTQCRVIRAVCLVCAAYTASVLDNAFGRMGYEEREGAFQRADETLGEFASWPFGSAGESIGFGSSSSSLSTPGRRKAGVGSRIAMGSSGDGSRESSILGLLQEVRKEMMPTTGGGTGGGAQGEEEDVGFELVAGVLEVLGKLDSLL